MDRAQVIEQDIHRKLKLYPENTVGLNRIFGKLDNLEKEIGQYMISAENHAGHPPSNGLYA